MGLGMFYVQMKEQLGKLNNLQREFKVKAET